MATPATNLPIPTQISEHVLAVDDTVKLDELNPSLKGYLKRAGETHYAVFGLPLVITSGNDGKHTPESKHYQNRAADIRSRDLTPAQQIVFTMLLCQIAQQFLVAVFDETQTVRQHWHCETA